eukprot:scaffold278664_cov18-Tisochrysis_lutea.AAC.2
MKNVRPCVPHYVHVQMVTYQRGLRTLMLIFLGFFAYSHRQCSQFQISKAHSSVSLNCGRTHRLAPGKPTITTTPCPALPGGSALPHPCWHRQHAAALLLFAHPQALPCDNARPWGKSRGFELAKQHKAKDEIQRRAQK